MNETTFRKNAPVGDWFWHTQAENGDIVADGGQGYTTLEAAVNGYLSQQGYSQWKFGDALPLGYTATRVNENEFIIENTRKGI